MRRLLLLISAIVLALGVSTGVANAGPPPGEPPCDKPAGEHNPNCQEDGPGKPPSDPPCDTPAGDKNPKCEEPDPGNGNDNGNGDDGCPPNAGPVTGVVLTVADGWEGGGGPAEIADLLRQIACGVHDATGL